MAQQSSSQTNRNDYANVVRPTTSVSHRLFVSDPEDDAVLFDCLDDAKLTSSQSSSVAQVDRLSSSLTTATQTMEVKDSDTENEEKTEPHSPVSTQGFSVYNRNRTADDRDDRDCVDGSDTDTEPDIAASSSGNELGRTDTEFMDDNDTRSRYPGSQSSLVSVPSQLLRDVMAEMLPTSGNAAGLKEREDEGIQRHRASSESRDIDTELDENKDGVAAYASQPSTSSYFLTTSASSETSSPSHTNATAAEQASPSLHPLDALTPAPQPESVQPTLSQLWKDRDRARKEPHSGNPHGMNQKFQCSRTSWIPDFPYNIHNEYVGVASGSGTRRHSVGLSANSSSTTESLYSLILNLTEGEEPIRPVPADPRARSQTFVAGNVEGSETPETPKDSAAASICSSYLVEPILPRTEESSSTTLPTTTTGTSSSSASSVSTHKRKRRSESRVRSHTWHSGNTADFCFPEEGREEEIQSNSGSGSSSSSSSSTPFTIPFRSASSIDLPGAPPSKRARVEYDTALVAREPRPSTNIHHLGTMRPLGTSSSFNVMFNLPVNVTSMSTAPRPTRRRVMRRSHTAPALTFGSTSERSKGDQENVAPVPSTPKFKFTFRGKGNGKGKERAID